MIKCMQESQLCQTLNVPIELNQLISDFAAHCVLFENNNDSHNSHENESDCLQKVRIEYWQSKMKEIQNTWGIDAIAQAWENEN